MKTDLDVSIRPGKWQKRGFQPAVDELPKSPLLALNELASKIREEKDPVAKKRMEVEYAAQSKAIEKFTSGSASLKLGAAITEMVSTFTVVVDPHPDNEEAIRMPETMTRDQWKDLHARLIQCKRAAAGWLTTSRKFASDRWGAEFVAKSEAQMELALGLEPDGDNDGCKPVDYLAMASRIGRRASQWPLELIDSWDEAQRAQALTAMQPVIEVIRRLGGLL